jgi:hypothetical protein
VRGIDRDPALARRVVERLNHYPSVHASASALTGRVLIEYDEHRQELDPLIAEIVAMELADVPDEDRPAHPLDAAPLLQSATRAAGATLGLALLTLRRLMGTDGPPVRDATPAVVAGVLGVVQGFPVTRNALRMLVGRHVADLALQSTTIVSLALAGNPVGLLLTGGEALRLLTETAARRAAWQRYTERLLVQPGAEPGAEIRLEAGVRTPLGARVVGGTGAAIGRSGLLQHVAPGEHIAAGSPLYGGPFVVRLDVGHSFRT